MRYSLADPQGGRDVLGAGGFHDRTGPVVDAARGDVWYQSRPPVARVIGTRLSANFYRHSRAGKFRHSTSSPRAAGASRPSGKGLGAVGWVTATAVGGGEQLPRRVRGRPRLGGELLPVAPTERRRDELRHGVRSRVGGGGVL